MTWANAKIKRILVRPNWVEEQVYPRSWKPDSSRTLLYLPLESDATDYSWNSVSTTPSNITYWTLWWVNCAIANWSSSIITFGEILTSWLTEWTVSAFCYADIDSVTNYRNVIYYRVTNLWWVWLDVRYTPSQRMCGYVGSRLDYSITSGMYKSWHHFLMTFNNSTMKIFVDWEKVVDWASVTSAVWWSPWTSWNTRYLLKWNPATTDNYWKWWAREILFEKIMWSDDDVSNYYKWIKNKLGF